jgi:hypothetical protein
MTPPNQAAWQHDEVLGWAGYKVADSVKTHELWGGGSYIFTNIDPTIHADPWVRGPSLSGEDHDLLTVQLGAGTLDRGQRHRCRGDVGSDRRSKFRGRF